MVAIKHLLNYKRYNKLLIVYFRYWRVRYTKVINIYIYRNRMDIPLTVKNSNICNSFKITVSWCFMHLWSLFLGRHIRWIFFYDRGSRIWLLVGPILIHIRWCLKNLRFWNLAFRATTKHRQFSQVLFFWSYQFKFITMCPSNLNFHFTTGTLSHSILYSFIDCLLKAITKIFVIHVCATIYSHIHTHTSIWYMTTLVNLWHWFQIKLPLIPTGNARQQRTKGKSCFHI